MDLTKDPADSYNLKESQEHEGNHSSVVVHQLKHINASLCRKEKNKRAEKKDQNVTSDTFFTI